MAAICQHRSGNKVYVKPVLFLYLIGTFIAALVAVGASFLFPTELTLVNATIEQVPPANLKEVLNNLLLSLVANPVAALANANYIGILAWAVIIGIALRQAGETTRSTVNDIANAISKVVKWVIALAPFGILGLVANTVADTGFAALLGYARILLVLIGCMLFIALVTNPLLVYLQNRYKPLSTGIHLLT